MLGQLCEWDLLVSVKRSSAVCGKDRWRIGMRGGKKGQTFAYKCSSSNHQTFHTTHADYTGNRNAHRRTHTQDKGQEDTGSYTHAGTDTQAHDMHPRRVNGIPSRGMDVDAYAAARVIVVVVVKLFFIACVRLLVKVARLELIAHEAVDVTSNTATLLISKNTHTTRAHSAAQHPHSSAQHNALLARASFRTRKTMLIDQWLNGSTLVLMHADGSAKMCCTVNPFLLATESRTGRVEVKSSLMEELVESSGKGRKVRVMDIPG